MSEQREPLLEPAPLDHPAQGSSPQALYLDLMKRCLTRQGFDDDLAQVSPTSWWKRQLWGYMTRALDRQGVVMRRARPELREEGRDWPERAETMIGLRRLDNLQHCIERVVADAVPGDVLEAGVWRGGAAIFMRAVLEALGETDRLVWVADSFQGLPKPDPKHEADRGDRHWTQKALAVPLEEVKRNFARYGLLDQQVRFLQGWFSETLPTAPVERLAVLRADGDMYGSTIDVLNALYPKVSVGGYVIIDDYGAVPGCRAATDHYRSENGITELLERIDWTGMFWQRQR